MYINHVMYSHVNRNVTSFAEHPIPQKVCTVTLPACGCGTRTPVGLSCAALLVPWASIICLYFSVN